MQMPSPRSQWFPFDAVRHTHLDEIERQQQHCHHLSHIGGQKEIVRCSPDGGSVWVCTKWNWRIEHMSEVCGLLTHETAGLQQNDGSV